MHVFIISLVPSSISLSVVVIVAGTSFSSFVANVTDVGETVHGEVPTEFVTVIAITTLCVLATPSFKFNL